MNRENILGNVHMRGLNFRYFDYYHWTIGNICLLERFSFIDRPFRLLREEIFIIPGRYKLNPKHKPLQIEFY